MWSRQLKAVASKACAPILLPCSEQPLQSEHLLTAWTLMRVLSLITGSACSSTCPIKRWKS